MKESIYPQLNDKDWLEGQLKEKRPAQIARDLGAERGSIVRAIKRLGLQGYQKRSRHPQLDDKEWLATELRTKSFKQIAEEIGSSVGNVADRAYRYGIALPASNKSAHVRAGIRKKFPNGRYGDLAANWKGGKRLTSEGHLYIYMPEHPSATTVGTVMEHRLKVEEKIGRYLTKKEAVHHVDLDKLNNDIDNLCLCPTNSAHRNIHAQLEKVATQLIRIGVIVFDFEKSEYYINNDKLIM